MLFSENLNMRRAMRKPKYLNFTLDRRTAGHIEDRQGSFPKAALGKRFRADKHV